MLGMTRESASTSVEPRSDVALMVGFYRGLIAGAPKAEALRQAKLALVADPRWAHPCFWAPFVLTGDPGEARQ